MPDAAADWERWEGRAVVAADGRQVGRISQVYLDQETGRPTWGSLHTGLVGAAQSIVPLQAGHWQGDVFQVPFSSEACRTAPQFGEDQELTHADQRRLNEHYGMSGQPASPAGAPAGTAPVGEAEPAPVTPEDAVPPPPGVTRSGQRHRVPTAKRESVRLRKTVVTEPVSHTINVRHEEVRIVREPILPADLADQAPGLQLSEEVHEVTLMQEEPVLEKTVVPVERIRLDKRVAEEQRRARGELRREQIELEGRPRP